MSDFLARARIIWSILGNNSASDEYFQSRPQGLAVILCLSRTGAAHYQTGSPEMSTKRPQESDNSHNRYARPGVMPRRGALMATTMTLMVLAAGALAPVASADPPGHRKDAAVKTYIIKTKTPVAAKGLAVDVDAAGGEIKNRYKRVYPGFSAELTADQVRDLKRDPQVESVIADAVVHSTTAQTTPTWGLDRIDQRATAGDGAYRYIATGAGVTAYIVDTGIRFTHSQFGGRAGERIRLRRQRRERLRLCRARDPRGRHRGRFHLRRGQGGPLGGRTGAGLRRIRLDE